MKVIDALSECIDGHRQTTLMPRPVRGIFSTMDVLCVIVEHLASRWGHTCGRLGAKSVMLQFTVPRVELAAYVTSAPASADNA